MDHQIEDIRVDIQAALIKMDRLLAGKSVPTAFLIERGADSLHTFLRDDLSLIEEAID